MSYTVRDLINQTLKVTGVVGSGQTANAEDMADCLQQLNQMIAQWQRQRWLVYGLMTTSLISTGATSYKIGAGGDFNIPRPDRLESAFVRFHNTGSSFTVDYPLTLINAMEDYNEITTKNLTTIPSAVFYDGNYPTGNAFFWPIPLASQYELFISVIQPLQTFSGLDVIIASPPEYLDAMQWNLAARIRPMYQLPPDPSIIAFAKSSLETLRIANAQIPSLSVPSNVPGGRAGFYNPYSDRLQ